MVLDQRALPDAERWIRCETVEEVADCIRTLAVRGAPAIGLAAAYGMALADGREDEAAELLRSTRPDGREPRLGARAVPRCARRARPWPAGCTGSRTRPTAGSPSSAPSCSTSGTRALTHCNTGALATGGYGTACGVLRAAWESGRLAEVWVDETRPLLQGARLTAWELRKAGIPHRVVADSAAGSLMARGLVDRVVVGADRIAANGDVANKVGTYPAGRARRAPRRAVLRGRAGVDDRPGHAQTAARSRSRSATRPRCYARRRRVQPGLRRDARGARDGDHHRGRRARAALRGVDRAGGAR